jgi:hypothetical protein
MAKRSAEKERYWRQVLQRQRKSCLSVRQFCLEQQLSEPSFHSWKRTIADRDWRLQSATEDAQRSVEPERCDDAPTPNPPGEAAKQADAAAMFVPLKLSVAASSVIEVVHPRGHLLRVPATFDAHGLRQLLQILDQPGDGV